MPYLALPSSALIQGVNSIKAWSAGSVPITLTKIKVYSSKEAGILSQTVRPDGSLMPVAQSVSVLAAAKAHLAEVIAKAYADGIVTAEEARAIADAQAKADAAQAYTEAWSEPGATNDADIRHGSDTTMIDGGKIYAGSQINIGNLINGDYCRIDAGDIDFYYWIGSTHVQYKSLKRREEGVGEHDDVINIPGYFKEIPKVDVIPKSTQTYSVALASYGVDQVLQCNAENITEYSSARWRFTVKCLLIASSAGVFSDPVAIVSGTDTRMLYWNHETLVKTLTSATVTSPSNTTQIILSGKASESGNGYIHGLRIVVFAVVDGDSTQIATKTWTSLYNTDPYTLISDWSNEVIDVTSGVHDVYFTANFYALAWENSITTNQLLENLNVGYTFTPDGQAAAGEIKWIATGE